MKLKRILAAAAASVMMLTTFTGCGDKGSSSTADGGASKTEDSSAPAAASSAADDKASEPAAASSETTVASSTEDPADGKTYTVGICQLLEHEALNAATDGFKQALTDKLGDNVKFDFQSAQGESTNCTTIVNTFVSSNVDLIMANATPALMAAASATDAIPVVGTSITSYEVAFGSDTWADNVTGASDLAPLDQQAKMLVDIFPDAKKVGVLYCSSEGNSKYQADGFSAALKELGVESKEYTVADSNEIQAQTTAAVGECDVLYIPTDNTFADATETVKNVVVPAKIPVVAGEEGICKGCGTVTLSISYYSMGYTAGEMAYDILVNGKSPKDLPVGFSEVTKKYNKEICEELGVEVPSDYTAIE